MEKKNWVTPELIVLVRNKPEEAILTACKGGVIWTGSPYVDNGQCTNNCVENCSALADS